MRKSLHEPIDQNPVKTLYSDFDEIQDTNLNQNGLNRSPFFSKKDIKEERLRLSSSISSITP